MGPIVEFGPEVRLVRLAAGGVADGYADLALRAARARDDGS